MWLYTLGIRIYAVLVALVARWNSKAKLWHEGRKNLLQRMAQAITSGERIVWIHVSSLGEFEQGRPIIEQLKREHPEYKILVTFFSPSGYEIRKNYSGADYIFYMPIDTPSNAKRFLDIVNPELVVFVKYEYWLNFLSELRRRKIRTFIVSAIFRRNSIFFKWYGNMWRRALDSFEVIFVQNEESKRLLSEIGFDNVVVAGDTRFDRVADIAAAAKRIELIEKFKGDKRLFVAGSTWGPDEDILQQLINDNPQIKFIVAPHEMDNSRIERLLRETKGGAVRYTECSGGELPKECQLLVLDTVGLLSSVYGYAEWSYIGGGFGVGIHNTLEAATFGLPIAFGPNYMKFKEARDMISLGAAVSVKSYEELEAWFSPLRDSESKRQSVARIAKDYTAKNQGATSLFIKTVEQVGQ